jgi:hypothetical protein
MKLRLPFKSKDARFPRSEPTASGEVIGPLPRSEPTASGEVIGPLPRSEPTASGEIHETGV